jgi:hypothetical protein
MTMNPTFDHLDDETLSAMLDTAAAEGGQRAAAAHLAACDLCAGRQAELRAAQAALAAAAVEPLDELTRRRLVAAALQATEHDPALAPGATPRSADRRRWLPRHPALIGSIAAALLGLLVGVPFVVGDGDGSDRTLSAQAPAELSDESAGPFLGDLGDLADQNGLRLRLNSGGFATDTYGYAPTEPGASPAGGGATSGAPLPAAAPTGGGLAGSSARTASPPATGTTAADTAEKAQGSEGADAASSNAEQLSSQPEARRDGDRDRADAASCVAALLDGPARTGRLLRSGVGTYQGRPAVVASFELDGGTVAFVTDRSGCAVLDRFAV